MKKLSTYVDMQSTSQKRDIVTNFIGEKHYTLYIVTVHLGKEQAYNLVV